MRYDLEVISFLYVVLLNHNLSVIYLFISVIYLFISVYTYAVFVLTKESPNVFRLSVENVV